MIQSTLGNGTAESFTIEQAKAEEQVIEENTDTCCFCKGVEKKDILDWFCSGSLFTGNMTHNKCYLKALKDKGLNDTGYKIRSGDLIEIFSETTGWELIDKGNLMAIIEGKDVIFATEMFPCSIQTLDEHQRFKHCFGITQATRDHLKKNGTFKKEIEGGYSSKVEQTNLL